MLEEIMINNVCALTTVCYYQRKTESMMISNEQMEIEFIITNVSLSEQKKLSQICYSSVMILAVVWPRPD